MATVTVPQKVDNPVVPRVRPRGLLSDLAYPVNASRWQAGVTFVGYDATNIPEVVEHDWCNPDDVDGVPAAAEVPAFQAFSVWDTEVCSTLAVDPAWLLDRTNRRVNLWTSFFLARELMTGSVTSNTSLQAAATTVSGTHSPVAALLRLEVADKAPPCLAGTLRVRDQELILHGHVLSALGHDPAVLRVNCPLEYPARCFVTLCDERTPFEDLHHVFKRDDARRHLAGPALCNPRQRTGAAVARLSPCGLAVMSAVG